MYIPKEHFPFPIADNEQLRFVANEADVFHGGRSMIYGIVENTDAEYIVRGWTENGEVTDFRTYASLADCMFPLNFLLFHGKL